MSCQLFRKALQHIASWLDGDPNPPGEVKPVIWIVVVKNHYDGLEAHVTLLAVDLIGFNAFDNSTNRGSDFGSNHWGESGTANATYGLRPWLNATGIHTGEGSYRTFSESFTSAVLTTTVPNKEWQNGSAYSTQDKVFLPSTTELGDMAHKSTYQIGIAYPYFLGADNARRVAKEIGGEPMYYWTRSPDSSLERRVQDVHYDGGFGGYEGAYHGQSGVRPALNLKSGILVSETKG